MRRFRFHIGTLVMLVVVLGVGFAALRESNGIWDNGIFTVTVGVLLTSVVLATHRTERRRAFWLGFALFGWAYLGLSLVPSIESRLITTKALAYLDSKMPRSISNGAGLVYADYDNDGTLDLVIATNSQLNALYLNKDSGTFQDVTTTAGLNSAGNQGAGNAWFPNILAGTPLARSIRTTENFIHIGHSLLAIIAAVVGGRLSRHLNAKNREEVQESVIPHGSTSVGSGG